MKNLKFIFPLLFVGLFFTGCLNDLFEQEDNTFQGSQIEFDINSSSVSEPAAGNPAVTVARTINLIAAQRSSDVSIAYGTTSNTTAVGGTHYNLVTPSPVTLNADSSTVAVEIEILDSGLTAGQSVVLELELQTSGNLTPAENHKLHTLTINGTN